VREPGRPDQKCRILKTWKQTDGTMAFEVQCLETEEYLTLVEMPSSEGGIADSSRGMKSRIYHWGQSVTPPAGVPHMPAAPISPKKDSQPLPPAEASDSPVPSKVIEEKQPAEKSEKDSLNKAGSASPPILEPAHVPAPTGTADKVEPKYALPESPETKPGPIQVETAPPSNWQESWGKADDHRSQLPAEKVSQTPPANSPTEPAMVPASEKASPEQKPSSGSDQAMPLPAEPAASEPTPNSEKTPPATLPIMTSGDGRPVESPDSASLSGKTEVAPESIQPAGYAHVDDRPGVAHVTDIPPAGAAKVAGVSKKPVVDFLRAMWKPSLKEPAPLQTVQLSEVPVTPTAPDASQIEVTLRSGLLPSHREMAAEYLSGLDRQQEPTVVPALALAASEDPAATVRAACVHCLVKMKANTPEIVGVLMSLKADPDLRVRREAHQALISFGLAKPEPENETIHQIGAPEE
jgi:hypothetical protein